MSILIRFIERMNVEIKYCHWKSIDKMDKVYNSTSDIDILIDEKERGKFDKILADFNAINVKPRLWMTYPSMDDYLLYDDKTGKVFHLHVHYRLIMGKKNVKEYVLPLESIFLDSRVKHEKYDTYIVKPEVDYLMLLLRYAVKYSRFSMFYRNLRKIPFSEKKELDYLNSQCNTADLMKYAREFDRILHSAPLLADFIKEERHLNLKKNTRALKKLKQGIKLYRRMPRWQIFGSRKIRKYSNLYAALGRNNAKHPVQGGLTIALVGCDGSGKTTVTNAVIKELRTKLSARKYYLGFNARSFSYGTRILALLSYAPRGAKFIFKNNFGKKVNILGQMIIEYGGYRDRKKLYKRAWRDRANGMIVFYERFPLKNTIDYPQMFFNNIDREIIDSSPLLKKLGDKLEKNYEIFRPADLNFFIKTQPDVIRQRREMSDKTFDKVKTKFDRVCSFTNDRDYFIEIDGNQPLDKVILDVKSEIFKHL